MSYLSEAAFKSSFQFIFQNDYAIIFNCINEEHRNTSTVNYPWQDLTGSKVNGNK